MEELNGAGLDWAVASRPHPEQSVSGDGYVVKRFEAGALLAVVDGLGHGTEAARAAAVCVDTLSAAAEMPIVALLRRCHERLHGTRGATVSVAAFDFRNHTMTWSGVGNVTALLLRADDPVHSKTESLVQRAGLLGSGVPSLLASNVRLRRGDLLVLATDGIEPGFENSARRGGTPRAVADRILSEHAKSTDDALVLAARYTGVKT
jgi:serine phosphatase RsbU (regulator of sigma subunit)